MRAFLIAIVLLATTGLAHSDELPATGAAVVLAPTSTGYEGQIVVPRGKYTDAQATSDDPRLAPMLDVRIVKDEGDVKPQAGAPQHPPLEPPPSAPAHHSFVRLVALTLKNGAIPQGKYPFTLRLAGDAPEIRDLLLTVPAARIEPLDTLIVARDAWKLRGDDANANQPQIWETTRTWLTNVTLAQRGDTDGGREPAGRINPTGKIADVPPGGNRLIELNRNYDLVGNFPLGSAKGKLAVMADQLPDPVSFNFEIRTRIWLPWLFAPMAAGLLLGWATRKWLTDVINLNREKEKTYALISLINSGLARNADPEFVTAARGAKDDAAAAINNKTVDEVRSATADAQKTYETAVSKLTERRAQLDKDIADFNALARTPFRAPSAVNGALATAATALRDGLEGLASNNVAKATEALATHRSLVQGAAIEATRRWLDAVTKLQAFAGSIAAVAGVDGAADAAKNFKALQDNVSGPLTQLENIPSGTTDAIRTALGALHGGVYALDNLLGHIAEELDTQLTRIKRVISEPPLKDREALHLWEASARMMTKSIREVPAAEPEAAAAHLEYSGDSLFSSLRASLLSQVEDKAQIEQIDAALKRGDAVAAVAKLAEFAAEDELRPKGVGAPKGGGEEQLLPEAIRPSFIMTVTAPPAVVYGYAEPVRETKSSFAVLAAANRRAVETSGWLLSLIYAAVIAVGGYFLFADKWVGIPLDFASVFFWAFAIDVGADAAVNAAKTIKGPA